MAGCEGTIFATWLIIRSATTLTGLKIRRRELHRKAVTRKVLKSQSVGRLGARLRLH
jgi:hypothetical protein